MMILSVCAHPVFDVHNFQLVTPVIKRSAAAWPLSQQYRVTLPLVTFVKRFGIERLETMTAARAPAYVALPVEIM